MAGTELEVLPSLVVAWEVFKKNFIKGEVLSRPPEFDLLPDQTRYVVNPYPGYDTSDPFLFIDLLDGRLPSTTRVVGLGRGKEAVAYPFPELAKVKVVHDRAGDQELVILYEPDTRSVLDRQDIQESRAVGSAGVFLPVLGSQQLTFIFKDGEIVDEQTGSVWNVGGEAISGSLAGKRLTPLFHTQAFWFFWAEIAPETRIFKAES